MKLMDSNETKNLYAAIAVKNRCIPSEKNQKNKNAQRNL